MASKKTKKSDKIKKAPKASKAPIGKTVKEVPAETSRKKVKVPNDKKLTRELKRVFGKKLKPAFSDLSSKFVFEFNIPKKATADSVRLALHNLLSGFPEMV